ncbi:MAG: DDE transposase [Sphingomonadales bacterium]|nr:MAG: DDE transposase [Sphingomonadales bacterium]
MGRFIQGEDRRQDYLLPASLDDYVSEDNPVRAIEAFIGALDLNALEFAGMTPAETGRPAYHPATMLKIYLYGYLNRVQSSRRLEREAQRNIELMWLTRRLAPDFKTIANFRRANGAAIRSVCSQFIVLCRQLGLFTRAVVAIDGSKMKAVNNRDKNYTAAKVASRMKQVQDNIDRYLDALDRADREEEVRNAPDQQVSLTDPDARAMASAGRGTSIVGYNLQTAVDAEHHLIVAHELLNTGYDRGQLSPIAAKAKDAMGVEALDAIADKGYFKGEDIRACEGMGITAFVPRPLTSGSKAQGRFGKPDFVYLEQENVYPCPAGEDLIYRYTSVEDGLTMHSYWSSNCQTCTLHDQCTTGKERRVRRWEYEAVVEAMERRLDRRPEAMRIRRQTVEHPFGTLKSWMGSTHFQMKTLKHVRTEASLHILAYNFKRLIAILGVPAMIAAIQT